MSDAALLVIDVQESFRHAPYWNDGDVAPFTELLQALIDGATAQNMPVLQVFHAAPTGHFSPASGHVRTLEPVAIRPDAVFHKTRHSALVGTRVRPVEPGRSTTVPSSSAAGSGPAPLSSNPTEERVVASGAA